VTVRCPLCLAVTTTSFGQVWRLFTAFLFLGKGFPLLLNLVWLLQYGTQLERGTAFQVRLASIGMWED
jgi:membrane associated rhomboid family serine protease